MVIIVFLGNYGINPKMLDFTLKTLTSQTLLMFYKNMDIDSNFKIPEKDFYYNTLKIIIRIYHLFLLKPLLVIKTKLFPHKILPIIYFMP